MRFKQYNRFQVDFSSKWTTSFGILMGLSFFLRIVYYFALRSFRDVSIIELLTSAIIGIFLCGATVANVNILRRDAAGLYGIIGAIFCLLVLIVTCTLGNLGRIILAFIWYSLTAIVLLSTVRGYLPGKLLAGLMFAIPVFVRLVFFDLGHIGIIRWVQELAVLSSLSAMGCFAMGLKVASKHK